MPENTDHKEQTNYDNKTHNEQTAKQEALEHLQSSLSKGRALFTIFQWSITGACLTLTKFQFVLNCGGVRITESQDQILETGSPFPPSPVRVHRRHL